ncbi:hypothetical protein TNCV_179881 [Trichonephila clavipes]|nr:hypothetical protein TNCV_179881 [Trichonephila clavipes]
MCHCPEIDGHAFQQLDSTSEREPETPIVIRGQKETTPIPRPWSEGESVEKYRREGSCGPLKYYILNSDEMTNILNNFNATDLVILNHGQVTRTTPELPYPQKNWSGTEQNRTVHCMVLKAKANDRRKNLSLSCDECRGS